MTWVEEYRSALARTIVRKGDAQITDDERYRSYFSGPFDYKKTQEIHQHLDQDKVWTLDSDPTEAFWTEFAGTFASTDAGRRQGIEANVSCSCGKYKEFSMVVAGTNFSDLLIALLQES